MAILGAIDGITPEYANILSWAAKDI